MAKDFELANDYDLAVESGDLQFVVDGPEVAQNWLMRMYWLYGEWYGNPALGMPWFDKIFKLTSSPVEKLQLITDTTLDTPGVKSIISITETHDSDHKGFLDLRIETEYNSYEDLSV